MFSIFVESVLFYQQGLRSAFRTSGSLYFSITFSNIEISPSPKIPLNLPMWRRSLTRIVIYCLLINFSTFPPVNAYMSPRLMFLKKGLMFFYVLLIEDLLSLIASLMFMPVFAIFEMFSRNGLILATIFSTDFWGLSTTGSKLNPIQTKSWINSLKRIFFSRSWTL